MQEFLNRVLHGNCVEVMGYMPNECVDLTVTSPPYDNLRTYNGYSFPFEEVAKQLYKVTKPGGVVVWVVNDKTENGSETLTSFKQALYFKEIGFNVHDTMIYRKKNPIPYKHNRYQPCFEYMFIFSKGKPKTFNPLLEETKNAGVASRLNQRQINGEITEGNGKRKPVKSTKYRENIWSYGVGFGVSTKDEEAFKHPAIFPEKLAEEHILSWSNEGDTVFDPMCGAGTTLKMAHLTKRNFIGIDTSIEYVKLSQQRLKQVSEKEGN